MTTTVYVVKIGKDKYYAEHRENGLTSDITDATQFENKEDAEDEASVTVAYTDQRLKENRPEVEPHRQNL